MKLSFNALALVLFIAGTPASWAAQVLYDPFNYSNGANLNNLSPDSGTHTWAVTGTSASGLDEPQAVTGNLTVPSGFPASTGNLVSYGGKGYTDRINIGAASSGSLYYSFELQVNNLGNLPNNTTPNQIIAGLNNLTGTQTANPTTIDSALWVHPAGGTSSNSYNLGISTTGASTSRVYGSPSYSTGDTLFVVGAYNFNGSTSNAFSRLRAYNLTSGDTVPASLPGTDTADTTPGAVTGTASLASFLLYQTNTVNTNTLGEGGVSVDDLRVGTSWSDIVAAPEPGALSVVASLFLPLGAQRRSRLKRM